MTASALAFGLYDPLSGSPDDASTTLLVHCTNGTPYLLSLDAGLGAGATVAVRKMTFGGDTINYSLYRDAARTQVWGETPSVDTVAGTGNGLVQSLTVYGRGFGGQNAAIGAYTDTVTVTVGW